MLRDQFLLALLKNGHLGLWRQAVLHKAANTRRVLPYAPAICRSIAEDWALLRQRFVNAARLDSSSPQMMGAPDVGMRDNLRCAEWNCKGSSRYSEKLVYLVFGSVDASSCAAFALEIVQVHL